MEHKKLRFIHTLLFKMILVFLFTMMVPMIVVIKVIPEYYTRAMTENISLLTDTVLSTAVTNLNTYAEDLERLLVVPYMDDSVMQSLDTLQKEYSGKNIAQREKLEARSILRQTLPNYIQYARNDIFGTLVCFDEKNALAMYGNLNSLKSGFDFSQEEWYKAVMEADGRPVFISRHSPSYMNQQYKQVFSVARIIKDIDNQKFIAILKVDADEKTLSTIMENIQLNVASIMLVLDKDGEVLYSNQELGEEIRKELKQNGEKLVTDGNTYNVISKEVKETGWQVKALVSETEYMNQIAAMQRKVALISVVSIFVAILIFAYLSSWITRPLKIISQKMKEVENGNFDIRFNVKKKDEIAVLGNAFNFMMEHLNELINKEYKAVIAAQKAEYFALQSQIEPHFIYNVLNGMIGINRMGDRELMENTIVSLAGLLRYMTNQADTITVKEEFDMLEKYCSLQKMRLQKRLTYRIEVQETVKHVRIPKLLVQPLVENAVIHGIEPTGDNGMIYVKASQEKEEWLQILVEDTGCGFDAEETVGKKESVGFENVISRLKITYKEAYVDVKSKPGEGTRIIVLIPLNEQI